ncbi:MAG: UvrD-helicase domain-containing protein [Erysipelotrichaceae bacterium]|jgi:ATP-dependent helicase/nuclease subunit A|nr:UvrD-helicase domain-containing protein [Erysipelotrichaceae bacterium]
MPQWNTQQQKAITTKHKNILVSASAGSGKTTVLIARLIDLVIRDRIPVSSILAMTFTEAAASEMKKRLAKELHALLQHAECEEEKNYIRRQLSELQNAHISTIHSFCLSIVQKYYYIIGLDGERIRHIMDNAAMTFYQQQAMETVMKKQYAFHDDAFLQLCIQFSARPENDEQLTSFIRSLAETAAAKAEPEAWLTQCKNRYRTYSQLNDLEEDILYVFYDYLKTQILLYEEKLQKIHQRLLHLYPQETKKQEQMFHKLTAISPCNDALRTRDYPLFRQNFIAVCHAIVPTPPDKDDTFYIKTRKYIQQLEDDLLALLFDEHTFLSDIRKLQPSIWKLIELCQDYRQTYSSIKKQQKVIDFNDMEHYALAILKAENGSIARKYQKLFAEIMVDEFQDSNDVQDTLVRLISRKNNVFRVGDIKQSIYGFRHARPRLMQGLIDHRTEHDEVIYLSNNYRSKKTIVDFSNTLFDHLMNLKGFEGSYRKEDHVETGTEDQLQKNVPVVFHSIDHNTINEYDHTIYSKHDFKAAFIADTILEIKEKEHRSWKDFAVLVRSNARKNDMKAAFDERNIPCFVDIKYGFYQSNAVQTVLSFLKFSLSPHDDISCLAVLLSPLAMMDTIQITDARLRMEKEESFYHYYKEHPFPGFVQLDELRTQVKEATLSEALYAIYEHNGFYASYTTMQEKTNLDLLLEKALRFEEEQTGSISSFLHMIENIKDAQSAEAIPIGSDENVVRVMSIHQSKGLQFPVVFLWSSTEQTAIECKDLCISDSDLGIAMKQVDLPNRYIRTTPFRIAVEHKKNKEELEEEMRILYVALTRAQQQMHIVDCIKSMEDYEEGCTTASVYERNGYTSWILQSFYEQHSPLLEIKRYLRRWPFRTAEKEISSPQPISVYQKPIHTISFSTASNTKEPRELPKLDLWEHTEMQHGTWIHELIAQVPFPYSEADIIRYAQQKQYPVTKQDIESLRMLAHDALYETIMQLEHYHELPYMVQDKEEILHGFIDFIAISKDMVYILDFKTDRMEQPDQFINMYQQQLKTYTHAIQLLYPNHTIRSYIYSLHLHQMIPIH